MLYDPKWEAPPETKPVDDWRNTLLKAADYIEQHGFCQHELSSPDGRVCLLGALIRVGGRNADNIGNAQARLRVLLGMPIVFWNDVFHRSQAEVVAALRAAAR